MPRMQLPSLVKKLSSQHRPFYCYLVMSLWLFLLLVVMYKYMETQDVTLTVLKNSVNDQTTRSFPSNPHPDIKTQRVLRMCNLPQEIRTVSEGQLKESYQLEGVLILLRHGDRGPLTHVRDIVSIDCATNPHPQLPAYETLLDNITGTPQLSQMLGPFHGFPLLPPRSCNLGQLTYVGVSQLLALGEALRAAYADRLNLSNATVPDDIVVYSTKYRRTFQSALAFLYTFLTPELLRNVVFRETPSLQFCFEDCACPASEVYLKKFNHEKSNHLNLHPAVLKLVNSASYIVYEVFEKNLASDPHSLRDALLAYVCHGSRLPCSEDRSVCVHTEQVTSLLSYIEWEARQFSRSPTLKRACILRAYGMLRNIVSHLVRIISEKKPKLVLYSGHDKTILYLTTALGIATDTTYLAHYASRFIIEVYRNTNKATADLSGEYYFRLLFNGKDFTNKVQFCKGTVIVQSSSSKGNSQTLFLCPIHTIIQFLHNDYFALFNASNFKDACTVHTK
ncbi:2-phosphoxylose phosphatase 1-like [Macrosteles quadrilineatus]|uniref:2-phosphoxylose phosphatase 1-like n=1 Tax=Macrosteles quadrilineatus TaxID=74068 RepID=UPI0023E0EE03|nr:2-phosphoxylose phosphatase 1-like [Macrosteles quadrilineatus]XP_054268245.1 2-phosphoxylose phosphatase 1-like [Macrosteles quadrilineatus]